MNLASVTVTKSFRRHSSFRKSSSLALLLLLSVSSILFLGSNASATETAAAPTKLYGTITDKDGIALPNIGIAVTGPE